MTVCNQIILNYVKNVYTMCKTRKLISVVLILSLIMLSSVFSFSEGRKIVLSEEYKAETISSLIEIGVVSKSTQDNQLKK